MARNFQTLSDYQDILDHIEAWMRIKGLNTYIKWEAIGDTELLDLLQVKFLPDYCDEVFGKQLIIIINPNLYERISESKEQIDILLNEQLDVIGYDFEKGKVLKLKQDYTTSSNYQAKVGVDNLIQAKEIKKQIVDSYKETLKEEKRKNKR